MSRPTFPAHVLAQRGVPITLLDGTRVTICYGFASLMMLEERHGSVNAAVDVVKQGVDGKAFTSLAGILAAGLMHETTSDGPLSDVERLAPLLDPQQLGAYSEAMGEAFTRAFPAAAEGDDDDADPTQGAEAASSPGASGITSPSSASESQTTNSGA